MLILKTRELPIICRCVCVVLNPVDKARGAKRKVIKLTDRISGLHSMTYQLIQDQQSAAVCEGT